MLDEMFGYLPDLARQALPLSIVAWLALQLLFYSLRRGQGSIFGGLHVFLAIWVLFTLAKYSNNAEFFPALHALSLSLLAIALLVSLVRAVGWAISQFTRQR